MNQFAIGEEPDSYVFGHRCPVVVSSFDQGGFGEITAADATMPGADGTVFGRDTMAGRTLTIEMGVNQFDAETGRAAWRDITTRWNRPAVRSTPGAVVPLRMRMPGSATVRVYGRPRKADPANANLLNAGRVDLICDFQAADNAFYGDVEQTLTLSLLPALSDGGLSCPIDCPIDFVAGSSARPVGVTNAGDLPTWPVIEFRGPVTNPAVEFAATGLTLTLSTALAYDQTVTIDTRPWVRTALRGDGASMAGYLSGPRLADLALPPGSTVVGFHGIDLTGTSSCVVRWRDAFSTP